jgi:cytoskeleton protein RodZ
VSWILLPQPQSHIEIVSTENRDQNVVYTPKEGENQGVQPEAAEQIQLSFFDAVKIDAMNIENTGHPSDDSPSAESVDVQAPAEEVAQLAAVEESVAVGESASAHDEPPSVTSENLGHRLRAARDARGMTRDEASALIRVKASILDHLENNEFDRIGHGVYLRGYLRKYLELLHLPLVLADRVLEHHAELPPLTTSGTISRPRYLFERYSGSALYLVLTGVIIVPAVLLAMRAGFDSNLVRIAPLDASENTAVASRPPDAVNTATNPTAPAVDSTQTTRSTIANEERPFAASMTPFPPALPSTDSSRSGDVAAPSGQHVLKITLAEPSWVEITTGDGQKLEYGLLVAGTTRTYHSAQTIDARLGNINGAVVEVDGKSQDLTAFRHSNVAHFKLASGESALSRSGG